MKKTVNLNECYIKIIKNQKARLEGESIEHFMHEISSKFFFGGKVDIEGESTFPISTYKLEKDYREIADRVLETSLQSATSCMTLSEFRTLEIALRKYFNQKLSEL